MRFSTARDGRERWEPNTVLSRHRHDHGYVTLVLAGRYVEAGDRGRFHLVPGDVALHGPFEAHCNAFAHTGAQLLNIPLPFWQTPAFPVGTIVDPDTIARVAETDMIEAGTLLFAKLCVRTLNATDWVDALAAAIQRDPSMHLETWARLHRLSPETISRGFKRVFGVAPRRFRAEVRAQRALHAVLKGRESLSQVAIAEGFSDQSHMTRAVVALTGKTPRMWRDAGKQAAVR